jgi:hypothetical protein
MESQTAPLADDNIVAEDHDTQPLSIRRLDRLETTRPSNPSGN